jgi:DNA-binding NarL/FixJ family response regulator
MTSGHHLRSPRGTPHGEVLVVDPRPLFAQGVAAALQVDSSRVRVIDPDAVRDVPIGPGVAAVALACNDARGVVTTLTARGRRVIAYGRAGTAAAAEAVGAGAVGVVPDHSDASVMRMAVDAALHGAIAFPAMVRPGVGAHQLDVFALLTRREREVLVGLLSGLKPSDIAERDFVSVVTVRNQVQMILTKLNVHSQLEAVAAAHAAGWSAEVA